MAFRCMPDLFLDRSRQSGLKKGIVTGWPERCVALQAQANRVRSAAKRIRPIHENLKVQRFLHTLSIAA